MIEDGWCSPEVLPFADVADRWVVKCPCGYIVEWATQDEATEDADNHLFGYEQT